MDFILRTAKRKLPLHENSFVKATAPFLFMRTTESKSMLAQDLGDCRDYRILFFIIGPMSIAIIIFTRSAGINGMTQTARAAWKV